MAEVPATLGRSRQRLGVAATPQQLGLAIPPLKIKHQIKTREEAAAGAVPGTWEYRRRNLGPTVDVVFIKQVNLRVYQVRDGDKVATRCASNDGLVPIPDAPVPQADRCATCARANWTDVLDAQGRPVLRKDGSGRAKQDPPDCTSGFGFLGILDDTTPFPGSPFWLVCKGTAEKPAREFLREWDAQGKTALFEWKVRLGLQEDRSGGLVWYLPVFTPVETFPLERFMPAYEAASGVDYVHFIGRDQVETEDDERPALRAPQGGGTPAGFRDDVPPPTDDDLGL